MTLAAVSLSYYRFIMPYGLAKFVRFAKNVWDVDAAGKTDEQIAEEGPLCWLRAWLAVVIQDSQPAVTSRIFLSRCR